MPALAKALMTAVYPVPDLDAAKAWFSEAFGVEPYFEEPYYVGYNVAGFELGLIPAEPPLYVPGNQGVIAYWGVENADVAWERLVKAGARPLSAVSDVGGGVRVATVGDPFGNAIGLVENPHFKLKA